jgi:hypothetical protein
MSISIDKEKRKEKERIVVNQLSMKLRKSMLLAALFTSALYSFNHLKPKPPSLFSLQAKFGCVILKGKKLTPD